jgi:RES domain-containing protein
LSHALSTLKKVLPAAPVASFAVKLLRMVPLNNLVTVIPHQWLYISGKKYRFNLAGARCIYFSETLAVAKMEYDSYWQGLPGAHQPIVIISADVKIARVLDLTNDTVLKALKVDRKDLFGGWRLANAPTVTQLIGTAVLETGRFSAIRYPSNAAEKLGKEGVNFAIFQDHIVTPDYVRVLGSTDKILEEWPKS